MRMRIGSLALLSGLDLASLWLWHRPAAEAPIQPLAWELPYLQGGPKKKTKRKKKKEKEAKVNAFLKEVTFNIGLK